MKPHRIFLAVNLTEEVRAQLSSYQERWPELPARWTKPENLHLTLVFLGNTSEEELELVKNIAKEVASRHAPFSLTLSRVQYGPDAKRPRPHTKRPDSPLGTASQGEDGEAAGRYGVGARMVWAAGEVSKELKQLQNDLAESLAKARGLSFVPEKHPFSLHLTLARFRELEFRQMEPEERPSVQEEISLEIPVKTMDIMESKLRRGGAEYTLVEQVPLAI